MTPPSAYRLLTLGRLGLYSGDGTELISGSSEKLLALLAYVASIPGRRVSRDHLIDLFWGDRHRDLARGALRQLLHRLREEAGESLLASTDVAEVGIASTLSTDSGDVDLAFSAGDFEAVLVAYTGDFSLAVVSAGSHGFEAWADGERQRLRRQFLLSADRVARRALEQGDTAVVRQLANRMLLSDPLDEAAWRLRFRGEHAAGATVHLRASLAEFAAVFARAERSPEPRTTELLRLVQQTAPMPEEMQGSGLRAECVGRRDAFATMIAAWRAAERSPMHCHIHGDPGIGKTRLLEEFEIRLRIERATVLALRAAPRNRQLPGDILGQLVALLAARPGASGIDPITASTLVDLHPPLQSRFAFAARALPAPEERTRRWIGALRELLAALADEGPFVLMLDDLHWWDDLSLQILFAAFDGIGHRPIHLVTTARRHVAHAQTASSQAPMALLPLDVAQVSDLIRSLGTFDDRVVVGRLAEGVVAASGGFPLLVMQALRLGLDRGHLLLRDGAWHALGLEPLLHELGRGRLVAARLEGLGVEAQRLLRVCAVLERSVTADECVVHGFSIAEAEALEHAGLLLHGADGWRIAHDLIADALQSTGSVEEQAASHRMAAAMELAAPPDITRLRSAALHLAAAGQPLDALACQWVRFRRDEGDRRDATTILRELLEPAGAVDQLLTLRRALPSRERYGSWRLPVAVLLLAALVVIAFLAGRRRAVPIAPLAVIEVTLVETDSSLMRYRLEVPVSPVDRRFAAEPQLTRLGSTTTPPGAYVSRRSADGSAMVTSGPDHVNGPTELQLISHGVTRRLASAPGDDVLPSWSPDGREVVFQTTRYAEGRGSFDLAIVTIATGAVRPFRVSENGEEDAAWSPDGTRVAFRLVPLSPEPERICWRSVDGVRERCLPPLAGGAVRLIGWNDPQHLLVTLLGEGGGTLVRLDVRTATYRTLKPVSTWSYLEASPDGRWVLCHCRDDRFGRRSLALIPVESPEGTVQVPIEGTFQNEGRTPSWVVPSASPPRLERLETIDPPARLPIGISTTLRLQGRDEHGAPMAVPDEVLRVVSTHGGEARLDAGGILVVRPVDARMDVEITAGGYRGATLRLTAEATPAALLVDERWSAGWEGRWIRSGTPLARLQRDDEGAILNVNGDSTYQSGVTSLRRFAVDDGLAVDFDVRMQLTQSRWQALSLRIGRVAAWTAEGPELLDGCVLRYPQGEGWFGLTHLRTSSTLPPAPPAVRSGRFLLRLQYFPDSSCGVAVNGLPVSRGSMRWVRLRAPAAIAVDGQAYHTLVGVRRVRVWRGIPRDVNWESLTDAVHDREDAAGPR